MENIFLAVDAFWYILLPEKLHNRLKYEQRIFNYFLVRKKKEQKRQTFNRKASLCAFSDNTRFFNEISILQWMTKMGLKRFYLVSPLERVSNY